MGSFYLHKNNLVVAGNKEEIAFILLGLAIFSPN
jgi:hypothetical protein